ncbi:MAG: response regulator [candidate division WOR-3 bacterium]|nr:response regulator [candidate division WOR-3 bacterium]
MKMRKILIVDDEKNILKTIKTALEGDDVSVDTAMNGEECLDLIEQKEFDLILLDLKMPVIDGIEVLKRLSEKDIFIPVVIITAHGTIDKAVEAMKLGAVDFIQKPFSPNEIREIVDDMFERNEVVEENASTYKDYFQLAKKSAQQREYDKALDYAFKSLNKEEEIPEVFLFIGFIYEVINEHDKAMKYYNATLSIEPGNQYALDRIKKLGDSL